MRAWAEQAGQPGEWLDWVDAALFAENMEKNLGFINFAARVPGKALEIESATASLKRIPGLQCSAEDRAFERSEQSWCLVSCNASFEPGSANHWVPCCFKECVSESTYDGLVNQQIAALKVRIAELQSLLLDTELEEDEESRAQLVFSINDEIASWLAIGQFVNRAEIS